MNIHTCSYIVSEKDFLIQFRSIAKDKVVVERAPPRGALHMMGVEAKLAEKTKLTEAQQSALSQQKRQQRMNNELFFRSHPELRAMTAAFVQALLLEKPYEVDAFAEKFFTDPELARSLGYSGWTRPGTPAEEPDDDEEYEPSEPAPPEDNDYEGAAEVAGTTALDTVDLEQLLISLFTEADKDGSGALDFAEFCELMDTANVGLSKVELKLLLSEADEDSDGTISYTEFVPLAVEVVQTMRLKQRMEEYEETLTDELRAAAAAMLHGHDAASVGLLVSEAAERQGTAGLLSRAQLKGLLRSPQLGLSKQQVNGVASSIGFDAAGMVLGSVLAPTLYER